MQSNPWQSPPKPASELERLILPAQEDREAMVKLIHRLSASDVFTYLPFQHERLGEHIVNPGETLPMMQFGLQNRPFHVVFTSQAFASWAKPTFESEGRIMISRLPAKVWFQMASQFDVGVVVNPASRFSIELQPEVVRQIAAA